MRTIEDIKKYKLEPLKIMPILPSNDEFINEPVVNLKFKFRY